MIPRKIELEGFLCYREKQVIDLNGCDLWVFSGRNGSGKSTVFDAITFALYGAHRGGNQGQGDLINVGADEFRIGFEFDLGPDRFRIKRGLRRGGRSDRQIFRLEAGADGAEEWPAVPETDKETGFDGWVARNIGLNYKMFTSSLMLRQGGAEKLLEAKPKERFEIVAEVADLKSYQQLHAKVMERLKQCKGRAETLRSELAHRRVVEPDAVERARVLAAEAERDLETAVAERDRLAGLQVLAGRWRTLVGQRAEVVAEAEQARAILDASEEIRAGLDRLRELDAVLPSLIDEAEHRAEITRREAAMASGRASVEDLTRKLDGLSGLADQARQRLEAIVAEIDEDESRLGEIVARRAALAAPIERARGAAERRRAVSRLEAVLDDYPPDLEDEVGRLAEDVARRAEWKAARRPLEDLAGAREGLVEARSRIARESEAVEEAGKQVDLANEAFVSARAEEVNSRLARDESIRRRADSHALLESIRRRFEDFQGLEGSPSCDRCGQPLTPEHYEVESRRLDDELDRASERTEEAERSWLVAEGRTEAAEFARGEAERRFRQAKDTLAEVRRSVARAEDDASKHEADCIRAFERLDESFRLAVAPEPVDDWGKTIFPRPCDLAEGHCLVEGLTEAERLAREARARLDAMRLDRARLEEARRGLDAIELGSGDDEAEAEVARLTAEADALGRCLESHRREETSAEGDLNGVAGRQQELRSRIAEIESGLAADRAIIEAHRRASERARTTVPAGWMAAFDAATDDELEAWEAECDDFRSRGYEQRAEMLSRAGWELESAGAKLGEMDAQIAEIPEGARLDPGRVSEARGLAAKSYDESRARLDLRQGELRDLTRDRDARAELEARALEADRELAISARLADLLGRDGLQRDLIREAEIGILERANPILRDVSGGDLELRLAGEVADDEALPLEVVDRTHGPGRTIGAAFLSGSQKFRVAVSLALGIGQYARGIDRPIQSVIIDEGFGCLDRQGRDEMIAQLNSLRGRLARIVLVSHQEEFAGAFQDGYHFEARDGSTEVREFHR